MFSSFLFLFFFTWFEPYTILTLWIKQWHKTKDIEFKLGNNNHFRSLQRTEFVNIELPNGALNFSKNNKVGKWWIQEQLTGIYNYRKMGYICKSLLKDMSSRYVFFELWFCGCNHRIIHWHYSSVFEYTYLSQGIWHYHVMRNLSLCLKFWSWYL